MFVRGSFLEGKFRCWEQIRYCGSCGKPDFTELGACADAANLPALSEPIPSDRSR